ncbi:hypothetical protein [Vibrio atypicus]|uniref:hypothetical protein n=1 Tax=Vibrio atypicus TaxID=558271 RepID=UPI00135BB88B|nr:hypothetical protein [Vibrio atypicus]
MSVSAVQSGYQVIEQSSKMAEEAALEISQASSLPPVEKDKTLEFNKVEFKAPELPEPSHIESLTKLNQSSQYSKVGTNMLQRDQDMIGTLLDIHI